MIKKYLWTVCFHMLHFLYLYLLLAFWKFQPEKKRLPKILGDLFRVKIVKNGELYHFVDVWKS